MAIKAIKVEQSVYLEGATAMDVDLAGPISGGMTLIGGRSWGSSYNWAGHDLLDSCRRAAELVCVLAALSGHETEDYYYDRLSQALDACEEIGAEAVDAI